MSTIKDYSFHNYSDKIYQLLREEEIFARVEKLQIARRFCLTCATALPLPGYTIITLPRGEEENKTNLEAYNALLEVRKQLFNNTDYAQKCVPVPDNSLHMTLADLVSQQTYVLNVKEPNRGNELIKEVKNIFDDFTSKGPRSVPQMTVKGLSLVPQSPVCLVAIVGPRTPKDYTTLMELRYFIYDKSPILMDMGVKRHFPYVFHITLAYIEEFLSQDECNHLKDKILEVNTTVFDSDKDIVFNILSAEFRKFDDVSRFDRDTDTPFWPVVHFNKKGMDGKDKDSTWSELLQTSS